MSSELTYSQYSRRKTLDVTVGDIKMGSNFPIRIQSMTTTDTMDTKATVAQAIRMIESGCELVRITAPSIKEAENLAVIKNEIRKAGFNTPLIADIHFTPNAAEIAARLIEKVRINPGNYVDKKKFDIIEYTESQYQSELQRIRDRFLPLVKICKEYGTAMRIGTNHGSLSDRIMSRYGDTPEGMVESALEFLRICRDENYHNIVLSMKSSNPRIMIYAYRLLVEKMNAEEMYYPLHLGVTEAGDGEDGRIKSALGIGSLLEDGLGDTIRVSLTEDPELEAPVARKIIKKYNQGMNLFSLSQPINPPQFYNRFDYIHDESNPVHKIGGNQVPVVFSTLPVPPLSPIELQPLGFRYDPISDKWQSSEQSSDYSFYHGTTSSFEFPPALTPVVSGNMNSVAENNRVFFNYIKPYDLNQYSYDAHLLISITNDEIPAGIEKYTHAVFVLETDSEHIYPRFRSQYFNLRNAGLKHPIIYKCNINAADQESYIIDAARGIGSMFTDGMGDGIWLEGSQFNPAFYNRIAFGILQAARVRISRTEFISCPSCGRTLFDLQQTTALIRNKTDHLKGLKIAVMGCIVNGPGEMADADYGYVGAGPGKISLYKGHELVMRNIASENAPDELISLIKSDGKWIEKEIV